MREELFKMCNNLENVLVDTKVVEAIRYLAEYGHNEDVWKFEKFMREYKNDANR